MWHILSCNPVSDGSSRILQQPSNNQKSKPGSWFISKSVTSESASSWVPGPRVLLLWQPLFLLWNVSSKGKQDNLESQARTGSPAFRLRPAVLCPQPACYTPEGLYRGALGSLATDRGTSLFKAHPGWVMWKLPTTSFFSFSLTLLAFIKSTSPFPFLYFHLTHSWWRIFSKPTQSW